jgi:hypothetical protein
MTMKTRTTFKAGARTNNNETLVKDPAGLRVKTHVRGGVFVKLSRAAGLKVKTRVHAGRSYIKIVTA